MHKRTHRAAKIALENKPEHLKQGAAAEQVALEYLRRQGCKLVVRNYNTRLGEVDLIMMDDKDLVFVEVRYRKNSRFGGAIESITEKKQQSICRAAEHFLQQNTKLDFVGCRFDVVLLEGDKIEATKPASIDWIKAAF